MKKRLRLSQCMIVKNEEKNIRQALGWARGIAFEQIVVDTGSSDRTVEIAEEMGAKVYHFEWIDDFAAAKNYAIEQCSGDWIAFLDADEYLTEKDAGRLKALLDRITLKMERSRWPYIIRCAWVQLGDDRKPFAVSGQDRIFRNIPTLRYQGRIHEQVVLLDGKRLTYLDVQDKVSILHTGYMEQAMKEKDKAMRNRVLLEKEVEENPENYNAWSYLGDALSAEGKYRESKECFKKALRGEVPVQITGERFWSAGKSLLRLFWIHPELVDSDREIQDVVEQIGYPETGNPDIYYFLALYCMKKGDYERAYLEMERALTLVDRYREADTIYLRGDLENAFRSMAAVCQELGKKQEVVRYGVLSLRLNRYQEIVLTEILSLLRDEPGESEKAEGTWRFLGGLYDLTNTKDLLFCYKCAKRVGFIALEERVLEILPEEEREDILERTPQQAENFSGSECGLGIIIKNQVDRGFVKWASFIRDTEEEKLLGHIRDILGKLKKEKYANYTRYVEYYNKYPFWGSLQPKNRDYGTLEKRAHMLKTHLEDLVWLYQRLEDYSSKEALLAICRCWTDLDVQLLGKVKAGGAQYFDLDLVPSARDEVFVDVGAYIGDTVVSLLRTYGMDYGKIYAYEADEKNARYLERNVSQFPRVRICRKGVGSEPGWMQFTQAEESSSSHFEQRAEGMPAGQDMRETEEMEGTEGRTEIVSLDEDIQEPVTWIKMDIEGMEYEALLGSRKHITRDQPKLSISVYHGYDDIWRIPRLIDSMNPSYKFYLRYYGGNLIPTEIVLTALPGEKRS